MQIVFKFFLVFTMLLSIPCLAQHSNASYSITVGKEPKQAQLFIRDHEQAIKVEGQEATLPGETVSISREINTDNSEVLTIDFRDSGSSGIYLTSDGGN